MAQLSQECSDEALHHLSTVISDYDRYKHTLDLSDVEINEIDSDPQTLKSNQGKFYSALQKWKSTSVGAAASYGQLVAIAENIKDQNAVYEIHKCCVQYSRKLSECIANFYCIHTSCLYIIEFRSTN